MTPLSLSIALLTFFPPFITAHCTTWAHSTFQTDIQTDFASSSTTPPSSITLETLACPRTNATGCRIPRRAYTITIPRTLNISASATDEEEISSLARTGSNISNPIPAFVERRVRIDTFEIADLMLQVGQGRNKTLFYVPFVMHASGVLGGCGNRSLDGVRVLVTAAFVNSSGGMGGTWGSSTGDVSGGGEGVRLGGGGSAGVLLACALAVVVSFAL